jgi:hypothetical protein
MKLMYTQGSVDNLIHGGIEMLIIPLFVRLRRNRRKVCGGKLAKFLSAFHRGLNNFFNIAAPAGAASYKTPVIIGVFGFMQKS